MIPLIVVLSVLALIIGGTGWLSLYLHQNHAIARFIERPNIVLVAKGRWCDHGIPTLATNDKSTGCIHKFRVECTTCGWEGSWLYDYHYFPKKNYGLGRRGEAQEAYNPYVPDHTCPSIEELIKPKSWELL